MLIDRFRLVDLTQGWWLVVLAGVLMTGCEAKLRVTTEPSGGTVSVYNSHGIVVAQGTEPVEFAPRFGPSNLWYKVEAHPGGVNTGNYVPTSDELTQTRFDALPFVRDPKTEQIAHELSVKLQGKEYQQQRVIKPTLDPNQGWIGFVVEERAYREVTEQGGAVPTRVVEFEDEIGVITGLALSPPGDKIVLSAAIYDVGNHEEINRFRLTEQRNLALTHANLHGVGVAGGGVQHITGENFQDLYPSFANDGRFLLFCSNRRRSDAMDILQTNALGRGGISNVYVDHRGAKAVKPSQARDGTIAFALYPAGWNSLADVQIWTVGGMNKFPTQIARGGQPQISPDGSAISYIGPDGNVWVVQTDGTDATQLTQGADQMLQRYKEKLEGTELEQFEAFERQGQLMRYIRPFSFPSWSPDGRRILYTSMEGNDPTGRPNDDIWVMKRDGTSKKQLTTNGSVDRFPLMSPDHQYVYFVSNRGLKWAIWRIDAPRDLDD